MSQRLVLLAVSTSLVLGGCTSITSSCRKVLPYVDAQEVPLLRVPVGLDGLDTGRALAIPDLDEPEVPWNPEGRCLEEPPVIITTSSPDLAPAPEARADAEEEGDKRPRRPPRPR